VVHVRINYTDIMSNSVVMQTYRKLAHYALELIPECLRLVSVRTVELFNLAVKDGDVSEVERLAKSCIPLSAVSDAVNRLAIEDGAGARTLPSLRALERRLLIAELRKQVCEAAKSLLSMRSSGKGVRSIRNFWMLGTEQSGGGTCLSPRLGSRSEAG
jgi:hypothetical protein